MNITFKSLVVCAMACVSCQNEISNIVDEDCFAEVSIRANISSSSSVNTRYGGDNLSSIAFTAGDKIGVFIQSGDVNPLSCWILSNNSSDWTSSAPVYWESENQSYMFRAFYPYVDGVSDSESVLMPSLLEQSGKLADMGALDFMTATKALTYAETPNGVVELTFQHQLCLFALTLSAKYDLADAVINQILLSGEGIAEQSTFSFSDSTLSPTADPKTGDDTGNQVVSNLNLSLLSEDVTLYYIVNPLEEKTIGLTIKYTKGSSTYTAMTSLTPQTLNPSTQYDSTISINNNLISVGPISIASWGDAVNLGNFTISSEKDSE